MGPTGGRSYTQPFGSRAWLPHLMVVFVDFYFKKSTAKGIFYLKDANLAKFIIIIMETLEISWTDDFKEPLGILWYLLRTFSTFYRNYWYAIIILLFFIEFKLMMKINSVDFYVAFLKFKFEFLFISHWKFSAFKYGSLGYLSRKGCHRNKGKCKTFPKDNHTDSDHLTPFLVYKAGCTQVVREFNSMTNKINNFRGN